MINTLTDILVQDDALSSGKVKQDSTSLIGFVVRVTGVIATAPLILAALIAVVIAFFDRVRRDHQRQQAKRNIPNEPSYFAKPIHNRFAKPGQPRPAIKQSLNCIGIQYF